MSDARARSERRKRRVLDAPGWPLGVVVEQKMSCVEEVKVKDEVEREKGARILNLYTKAGPAAGHNGVRKSCPSNVTTVLVLSDSLKRYYKLLSPI